MPYDGLSQRAPRLVRARRPHGADLVVNRRTDALFRRVYEFGWNGGNAVLDRPQPLWGTCRPPPMLAAPPCGSAAGSSMYDRNQVVVTLSRTIEVTATGRREAPGKKNALSHAS